MLENYPLVQLKGHEIAALKILKRGANRIDVQFLIDKGTISFEGGKKNEKRPYGPS